MKKKILSLAVAVAMVAVMAFAMTGCGKSSDDDIKTSITFSLDWTPNTNHTGVYVAKALGYYDEAGLDVKIVQPAEHTAEQMTSAGEAEFAIGYQDTMAAALETEDTCNFTAVAAVIQHNTSGIMSRKGDGITSPKGLTGKTYSTWDTPIEQAMLKTVINKDGGDFNKMKQIPNNITDEPAALKAKQTDAIWVYEGWGKVNAGVEGVDVDYFGFADYDKTFDYYSPVIIGNNDFLKDNADKAKAFLEATAKGYEYAAENPEKAADILIEGDETGSLENSADLVKASQEFLKDKYIADAEQWGVIDAKRWNRFYKWLYDNGLTKTNLTDKGFTNDYLPEK
ncbi:MAG: ABC transporter substrate-binding protein [Bacillota bacterium]|nr:ABC transporter substrate-binding protein [Bacillota bacterium]